MLPKPADDDIRTLARREASTATAKEFQPITRGPLFALLALAVLGVLSLPWLVARLLFRRRARPA